MQQRQTVRIILINKNDKILLFRAFDPTTTSVNNKSFGPFWCTPGGKLESGESFEQAALRELFEETGYTKADVEIGPVVWYGKHEMILSGKHVELDERFIVMYLQTNKPLQHDNFTENEKNVVTSAEWLSMSEILHHKEAIFPAILRTHLAAVLNRNYPPTPQWVDLSLEPLLMHNNN